MLLDTKHNSFMDIAAGHLAILHLLSLGWIYSWRACIVLGGDQVVSFWNSIRWWIVDWQNALFSERDTKPKLLNYRTLVPKVQIKEMLHCIFESQGCSSFVAQLASCIVRNKVKTIVLKHTSMYCPDPTPIGYKQFEYRLFSLIGCGCEPLN